MRSGREEEATCGDGRIGGGISGGKRRRRLEGNDEGLFGVGVYGRMKIRESRTEDKTAAD